MTNPRQELRDTTDAAITLPVAPPRATPGADLDFGQIHATTAARELHPGN